MLERDVSRQVKDFLEARGWRLVRTQFGFTPGTWSTGEPGMPDYLALRYEPPGRALAMWLEVKGPNDKRRCACPTIPNGKPVSRGKGKVCKVCRQKAWHDRERQRGASVVEVSNIEAFAVAYGKAYGLLHSSEPRGQLDLGITAIED